MNETANIFEGTLANLAVDSSSATEIAARRDEITKALNKEFRGLDGSAANQLMVGSYGRWTAIRGISDLDLLYLAPASERKTYEGPGGPSRILKRARDAIKSRFPTTAVRVDRLVVVVEFTNFSFDVQPVLENDDDSFSYPDTYADSWKVTKPREEIAAVRDLDDELKGKFRRLCKLARAWKNKHGIVMGGLLMDTLAANFLRAESEWSEVSPDHYGAMCASFFDYLAEEDDHEFYAAIGSGQRVHVKHRFQRAARAARELATAAIAAQGQKGEYRKWRALFGRVVPKVQHAGAEFAQSAFDDTEEFIEDKFTVDIRHYVEVECVVTQDGFRPQLLEDLLAAVRILRPRKRLRFSIRETDVPAPYAVRWKVLNRGAEAERRDDVRGQISSSNDDRGRVEYTKYRGEHLVECYVIKNERVVARASVVVPIAPE